MQYIVLLLSFLSFFYTRDVKSYSEIREDDFSKTTALRGDNDPISARVKLGYYVPFQTNLDEPKRVKRSLGLWKTGGKSQSSRANSPASSSRSNTSKFSSFRNSFSSSSSSSGSFARTSRRNSIATSTGTSSSNAGMSGMVTPKKPSVGGKQSVGMLNAESRRHSMDLGFMNPGRMVPSPNGGLDSKWKSSSSLASRSSSFSSTSSQGSPVGTKPSILNRVFGLFNKKEDPNKSLTRAEKKFKKDPYKFLSKNGVSSRDLEKIARQESIKLKTGETYVFGLKPADNKRSYMLTVKPPGSKGIKGAWLTTKETASTPVKGGPKFVFTGELGGCTIYACANTKTNKLSLFHHYRKKIDDVKVQETTGGKFVNHQVKMPDRNSIQQYSKALSYKQYSKTDVLNDGGLAIATPIVHRNGKGDWKMIYQNLRYPDSSRPTNFQHGPAVKSTIYKAQTVKLLKPAAVRHAAVRGPASNLRTLNQP